VPPRARPLLLLLLAALTGTTLWGAEANPVDALFANADYVGAAKKLAAAHDQSQAWKIEAAQLMAEAWPKAIDAEAARVKKGLKLGEVMDHHPMAEATVTQIDASGCTVMNAGAAAKVPWRTMTPKARLAMLESLFPTPTVEQRRTLLALCALHGLQAEAEAQLKQLPLSDSALETHVGAAGQGAAKGATGAATAAAPAPDDGGLPRHDGGGAVEADAGVPITTVTEGSMAAAGCLRVGDRVLAVDGWRVDDATELQLLRSWLQPDRDHETWVVLRGAKPERTEISLEVMGSRPVGILMGPKSRCDDATVAALDKTLGLQASDLDRAVLGSFPPRAARPLLALAQSRPTAVPRLKALVKANLDLCEDRIPDYHPPAEPLPNAFLTRLERFYAAIAALGDAPPSPGRLGEDRWFMAAYFPYPALPRAETPHLTFSDADLTRFLADRMRGNPASQDAQDCATAHIWEVAKIGSDARGADAYLHQVMAALIDPARHGGWPYRTFMLMDQGKVDEIVTQLRAKIDAGGPDLVLHELALVGPLARREDWDGAAAMVSAVYAASPWLGDVAAQIMRGRASTNQRADQLAVIGAKLAAIPAVPRLEHDGIYRYCGSICPYIMPLAMDGVRLDGIARQYRDQPARVAEALTGYGGARLPTLYDYDAISKRICLAAVQPITGLPWRNADGARIMVRAFVRIDGLLEDPQPLVQDMAAVAYCVLDRRPLARRWVHSATAIIDDLNQRADQGDPSARRLKPDMFLMHQKVIDGDGPMGGLQIDGTTDGTATDPDGGAASGPLRDGKRLGPWKIVYPDGHEEQGWYLDDQRSGPWSVRARGGAVVAEGMYAAGHRAGPWRFFHPDGVALSASGCYLGEQDGDGDRVGPWRWWHANGALKEEGFLLKGKRSGVWRSWHANGHLASEGEYADDRESGAWLRWDENGARSAADHHDAPAPPPVTPPPAPPPRAGDF
jgi:antitoxin component YwqK of YwqJK toxin-antitoxin module